MPVLTCLRVRQIYLSLRRSLYKSINGGEKRISAKLVSEQAS